MAALEAAYAKIGGLSDPVQKQQLALACRAEQRALAAACRNMGAVSKELGIVLGFLQGLELQLAAVEQRLEALQEDVAALRADLRRLVGRPALDLDAEWLRKRAARGQSLRSQVYVEPSVCHKGEKEDFSPDSKTNPPILVSQCFRKFFEDEKAQVLLFTGRAGSGKSTAMAQLQELVLRDYSQRRKEQGVAVLLLRVNLPTLRDPLASLVEEGLGSALGMSELQVRELRERAATRELELVFVLDGYDELSPDLRRNLYLSNNLEQLNCRKLVVTARSELFTASGVGHWQSFAPLDNNNPDKDELKEALAFVTEFVSVSAH